VDENKAGEVWAIALSEDGQYLASTTYDGRINVWDLVNDRKKIREFETKGSFGMCIDLSRDGRLTASGHENGGVYVFNNETGRMLYSLLGMYILAGLEDRGADRNRPSKAGTDSLILAGRHSSCSRGRRAGHYSV
jgi:WD40 repeat protein